MTTATIARLPLPHRVARAASVAGIRGAQHLWRVAERLQPLPRPGLVVLPTGVPLAFDAHDWVSVNAYRGLYERAEMAVLRHVLRSGDVVVDVGANIGYFTASAARWIAPGGRVVALEPSRHCLDALASIVEHVGVPVDVHAVAAGAQDGTAVLALPDGGTQAGLATLRAGGHGTGEVVTVQRLEHVLAALGLDRVAMIKIDVEGFEREVLVGLGSFLVDGGARSVLVEVSPEFGPTDHVSDLVAALATRAAAFAIGESGAARRRARLTPIDAGGVATCTKQFNLLLVDRSELEPLLSLIDA